MSEQGNFQPDYLGIVQNEFSNVVKIILDFQWHNWQHNSKR